MPATPPLFAAPPPWGTPSPGRYLRVRREGAGVTIDQAASLTCTDPTTTHRYRAELLREVEADRRGLVAADRPLVTLLGAAYPFDQRVLWRLVAIAAGASYPHPQLCRLCLCSWEDACVMGGHPCAWSSRDVSICTTCEARMDAAAAADPLPVGAAA